MINMEATHTEEEEGDTTRAGTISQAIHMPAV
jgi:hypothetical protein